MTSSPAQRLQLAREYLAEREKRDPLLAPSRTYGNATMPSGSLKPIVMQSGRGDEANQHKQYTGAGFQAQIDRRTV